MSLPIDQDVRAALLVVMSRVREPRTLREISWHIQHVALTEVAYTLDAMVIRGEVRLIHDPNASIRYVLAHDYYRIPDARGPRPDVLVNRTFIVFGVVAAVAAAALIWRSIPWN